MQGGDGGGGSAEEWRAALFSLLASVPPKLRGRAAGISLDGTSSTALIALRYSPGALGAPLVILLCTRGMLRVMLRGMLRGRAAGISLNGTSSTALIVPRYSPGPRDALVPSGHVTAVM